MGFGWEQWRFHHCFVRFHFIYDQNLLELGMVANKGLIKEYMRALVIIKQQ